jgi:hypothetical protein
MFYCQQATLWAQKISKIYRCRFLVVLAVPTGQDRGQYRYLSVRYPGYC